MRSLRDMANPYQHALKVSIVGDTCMGAPFTPAPGHLRSDLHGDLRSVEVLRTAGGPVEAPCGGRLTRSVKTADKPSSAAWSGFDLCWRRPLRRPRAIDHLRSAAPTNALT